MNGYSNRYWILPHIADNAESSFKQLQKDQSWQLGTDSHINKIRSGDKILFYISDKSKKVKYFSGEAIITREPHEPTRAPRGDNKYRPFEIDFKIESIWDPPVFWTKNLRDNLDFVRSAPNVGMAFKNKTIIPIDEKDYNTIVQPSKKR